MVVCIFFVLVKASSSYDYDAQGHSPSHWTSALAHCSALQEFEYVLPERRVLAGSLGSSSCNSLIKKFTEVN